MARAACVESMSLLPSRTPEPRSDPKCAGLVTPVETCKPCSVPPSFAWDSGKLRALKRWLDSAYLARLF